MFTADCTSHYPPTDLVYFLEVTCSSDTISLFGNTKYTFTKQRIGLILVSADILIVLILLSMLWLQGWNEGRVCEEGEEAEVAAARYSVEIRNVPGDGGVRAARQKGEMW